MGVGRKIVDSLVDDLRKNFLYQTPKVVWGDDPEKAEPNHVFLKMSPHAYKRMMQTIQEHGGWDLSVQQRQDILDRHTANVANILNTPDISNIPEADLKKVLADCQGTEELNALRSRVESELRNRAH